MAVVLLGVWGAGAIPAIGQPAAGAATTTRPAEAPYLFRSPSGNVNCAYFPADGDIFMSATLTCEVLRYTGTVPRRPADCDLDWVASASMTATSKAASLWSCQGDTIAGGPDTPVLAYGKSVTRGPFKCTSSTSGIRCERTRSRIGFSVGSKAVTRF